MASLDSSLLVSPFVAPPSVLIALHSCRLTSCAATCADMVMNFETIQRPLMRSMILLAFFIFFVVTIATTPSGTSHLSHVGGFLCGLFPAFPFLPNFHSERWEAWLPVVGGLLAVVIYVTLPAYFYRQIYPAISC